MKFELKPLHKEAIPSALERAERYRLLNEPGQAESICLDILLVDAENQPALVTMLLAITDQFDRGLGDRVSRAREILPRLHGEYEQRYYAGIICERRAKAQLKLGGPGSGSIAYEWLREAMGFYEKAEAVRHEGNDDAVLRWNTCARRIMGDPDIRPREEPEYEPAIEW